MAKLKIHVRFGMTDQAYCSRYIYIDNRGVLPSIDDLVYVFTKIPTSKFCKQCIKKYRS